MNRKTHSALRSSDQSLYRYLRAISDRSGTQREVNQTRRVILKKLSARIRRGNFLFS